MVDMVSVHRISASERPRCGLLQAKSGGEPAERPDQLRGKFRVAQYVGSADSQASPGRAQSVTHWGKDEDKRPAIADQSSIIVVGSSTLIICGNSGMGGRS